MRPAVSKLAVTVYGMPHLAAARAAARISSGADMVSIQATSAPPSRRPSICSMKTSTASSSLKRSERSQEVARRSDRTGDDDGPPRAVGDFARDPGGQAIELAGPALELVQHQAAAVGPETVGQNDVGARVDESLMQALDPVRMLGVPEFGRIAGSQAHGEQVGAGRAVREQRPAFGQKGLQHVGFSRTPPRVLRLHLALRRTGARLGGRTARARRSAHKLTRANDLASFNTSFAHRTLTAGCSPRAAPSVSQKEARASPSWPGLSQLSMKLRRHSRAWRLFISNYQWFNIA